MNISKVIFEKLKKMLKIAYFAKFGPKYLGPQMFPRHAVCGSKLEIWSSFTLYSSWGYSTTLSDVTKSYPYSRQWGPLGWLLAPNIFHLANEFDKGKKFCNIDWFDILLFSDCNEPFSLFLAYDVASSLSDEGRQGRFIVRTTTTSTITSTSTTTTASICFLKNYKCSRRKRDNIVPASAV